jgi:hypothetical protein
MNITGSVVSMLTGAPLKNVTIWEIQPDGRGAWVIGTTDSNGNYNVSTDSDISNVNFAIDGYTGESLPVSQVMNTDQILLAPSNMATASVTVKNIPGWVWLLVSVSVIYLLDNKRK